LRNVEIGVREALTHPVLDLERARHPAVGEQEREWPQLREQGDGVVEDAISASNYRFRRQRECKTGAWRKVVGVVFDSGRSASANARDDHLPLLEIEVAEVIVYGHGRRDELVSQAQIQRQPRVDFPVIL